MDPMTVINWRRTLAAGAAVVLIAACSGGRESDDTLAPLPTGTTSAAPTSTADITTPSTPVPTAPPTASPSSAAVTTVAPTEPPTTVAPTEPPTTPAPTEPPTTPAPTAAPTQPPSEGLTLDGRGVGAASFGDDPDTAIAAVSGVLGDPTDDSGWVDPFTISACPGNEYRRVSWGAFSLQFSDSTSVADGRRHFFGYEYGEVGSTDVQPPGLETSEGIGIGSTVAELKQAYPGVAVFAGEEGLSSSGFEVQENRLGGQLTDPSDAGFVVLIRGGDFCGG